MTKSLPMDSKWHLDRRVPIALILAIILQTGAAVAWVATTNARISVLEHSAELSAPQGDRLTRVEVKVDNLIDGITEIKSILRNEPSTKKMRTP